MLEKKLAELKKTSSAFLNNESSQSRINYLQFQLNYMARHALEKFYTIEYNSTHLKQLEILIKSKKPNIEIKNKLILKAPSIKKKRFFLICQRTIKNNAIQNSIEFCDAIFDKIFKVY